MTRPHPEELERWRRISAEIDDRDAEPADEQGDLGALARRPGETAQRSGRGASPLELPIEDGLGALVAAALDRREGSFGLEAGRLVGPYRIVEPLGSGGMGAVYLASRADGAFDQQVALKVLHRSPADEAAHQRFVQERQILAGLRHPNIARLLDGGVVDGRPYLVLERVEGEAITEYCRSHAVRPEERIRLLLQACDAVAHAHSHGIVHRDLKPSNLLVERGPDGSARVAVLDFGIARIEHADLHVTSTGEIFGTPGYMSPEQALGDREAVDRRTDVYSLGVVLYELLSGARPYEGETTPQILHQVLESEPTPLERRLPGVQRDLATITETCLARLPQQRYDSVRELSSDLERFLEGRPIAARPVGWGERLLRRARRRPKTAALIAGSLLLTLTYLALAVTTAIRHARDLEAERNAAIAARRDAEGLLDFLLDDLHEDLDRIGRLDLLDKVARLSLDYYDRRGVGGPEDELRRGRALSNAGGVLESSGDIARAIEAYSDNLRRFDALAAVEPDPRWQRERIRAHAALADAHAVRGDLAPAREHAREALQLGDAGTAAEAGLEGWSDLLFETVSTAGWIEREAGDPQEARRLIHRALDMATAESLRPEADPKWLNRRAMALSYLGLMRHEDGDAEAALERYEQALTICSELVARAPDDTAWREELLYTLNRIASAHLDRGGHAAALAALERASTQADLLLGVEPGNAEWAREQNITFASMAVARRELGDLEGALRDIGRSLEISRRMLARFPTNHSAANDLAWDLVDAGRIQHDLGRRGEAAASWREALDVVRRAREAAPQSLYYMDTEAQALLELGRTEEARPLVAQLREADWHAPELWALVEREQARLRLGGTP